MSAWFGSGFGHVGFSVVVVETEVVDVVVDIMVVVMEGKVVVVRSIGCIVGLGIT
ncbi:MAG: hypothetical protein HY051_01445 [Candidatus Aenigmarchaeota archaeon]|nr:hypothetical protein [Candidatus Aenigmarchaeota archaeon]